MKIEEVTCIWMFVCVMNFWAARNYKTWSFGLFGSNLHELGLFHPYFVCKCSFREFSMIKIVILENRIIENSKIRNLYTQTTKSADMFILCALIFLRADSTGGRGRTSGWEELHQSQANGCWEKWFWTVVLNYCIW